MKKIIKEQWFGSETHSTGIWFEIQNQQLRREHGYTSNLVLAIYICFLDEMHEDCFGLNYNPVTLGDWLEDPEALSIEIQTLNTILND